MSPDKIIDSYVVDRHVFYHNSVFDAAGDSAAIAPDKEALLPGGTATFANYTSFTGGINGLMVDISGLLANLPAGVTPEVDDFRFRIGNDNDATGWEAAELPSSITVSV